MTRARNLARFAIVAAALVWGFAFNAAAYVAWVTYVLLPGSRVTGAPPMNWASAGSDATNGIRHAGGLDPISLLIVAACGVATLYMILAPRKETRP